MEEGVGLAVQKLEEEGVELEAQCLQVEVGRVVWSLKVGLEM